MSNPATLSNICCYVGQNVAIQDTITLADGTAVDISLWSIEFVVYAYGDPGTVYFRETTGGGGITYPNLGTDGVLRISGSRLAADTIGIRPGTYEYAIMRTDAYAVPTTGIFTLLLAPPP